MPITFSSPRAQPEVVYFFLYQMKAPIFLIANPKVQLQILCSFGDITKSVKLNGIPENNLCIFITASSPGVHTFFCLWRVNKKLSQGKNFTKCISEVKVNQLKVKNMHVRMDISTFKFGQKNDIENCRLKSRLDFHLKIMMGRLWQEKKSYRLNMLAIFLKHERFEIAMTIKYNMGNIVEVCYL